MNQDLAIFRKVYDAYPDGVLLVDDQGLICLANPAVTALLGYSSDELLGQPVDMLVPDSVAPRHAAYRQGYALAPRARPMGTELALKAKCADGSEVMVEIALSPLEVTQGEQHKHYVVASVRGISAYPRVKRAMQRARYNEFVVQLGRVAVDTMDPDELLQRLPAVVVQALQVQAVGVFLITPNQLELRCASYAGPQPEEGSSVVYANRPHTFIGYVVAQRTPVIVAHIADERRFEMAIWSLPLEAKSALAVPLADRGKVIGVLATWSKQLNKFGDDEVAFLEAVASLLSTSLQRAQAEAQMRHAQRLETVGQLTGGIAHDFNNLLMVILGNLQMLSDLSAVQADAVAPQLVAAAWRAGQRGADLTGKLLAFSRRLPLAPKALDPAAVLHSLADMLRRTLGNKLQVHVHAPSDLPCCFADPVQLEAALLNVAINARDAIEEAQVPAGKLVLRCGVAALPHDALAVDPKPGVWFSMQDNGCGMGPEVRERAFEPFFTTKEAGRGTGLGLATVYGFVAQSHGHIRLDSTPGQGTTVTLTLPAQAATVPSDNTLDGAHDLPKGLRVLLVEDHDDVRAVTQAFLRAMGCEVQVCASAEAALAALASGARVDLLFSDITLGDRMDGIELARLAQQQRPTLAVLLCSGYSRFLLDEQAHASQSPNRPKIELDPSGGLVHSDRVGGSLSHGTVLRKPFTQVELARAMLRSLHRRLDRT